MAQLPLFLNWLVNQPTVLDGSMFSNVFGVADLRQFGATSSTNSQPAVAAAVAAGYKHVFLPAGFFYQGGGTGAQTGATEIPADLEIIGEDPKTSLIKAVDRTNAGNPGFIYLNSFSIITNCGTQSYIGDQLIAPIGTLKTIQQPRWANYGDAKVTYVPQPGNTAVNMGATITSPEGVQTTDNPGISVIQNSGGDGFYSATPTTGVGLRIETYGNPGGDTGLLINNALSNVANVHTGIHINEAGTNSSSFSILLTRMNGATSPLLRFADTGPSTATTDWVQWVIQDQSSGLIRNTFQTTTAFSGTFDFINAGNGGGTFTGNFVNYTIANVPKFTVDSGGNITSAGAITTALTAVAAPSNANAAAAGVPVNGLYRDVNAVDPCKVYIRTV